MVSSLSALGLVLGAGLCTSGVQAATWELKEHSGGQCMEYPADGYCSGVGLGGKQIFIFDQEDGSPSNMTHLREIDLTFQTYIASLEAAARALANEECVENYRFQLCMQWFRPCDEEGRPLKGCKSSCEKVLDLCETAFQAAIAIGKGDTVIYCDQEIGAEIAGETSVGKDYLAHWKGSSNFEEETYEWDPLNTGTNAQMRCASVDGLDLASLCKAKTCPEPLLSRYYPVLADKYGVKPGWKNPDDVEYCANLQAQNLSMDCSRCFSTCELPCPYPYMYEDNEMDQMWAAVWVPGFIAFWLNSLVLVTEALKISKMKKKQRNVSEYLVFAAAFCGLLIASMESLPSMFLKEDMRCNGDGTYSVYGGNANGNDFCFLGQFRHFVLVALMATVCCSLWKVRKQLIAARTMKKYSPTTAEQSMWVASFVFLPMLLALLAAVTKPDFIYHASSSYRVIYGADGERLEGVNDDFAFESVYAANNVRGMYTCQMFFDNTTMEVIFFVAPLLINGFFAAGLSISLLYIVHQMSAADARSQGNSKQKKKNVAIINLAKSMLRFAFVAILLVILNTIANMIYLPEGKEFGTNADSWTRCILTGIPQSQLGNSSYDLNLANKDLSYEAGRKVCGDLKDLRPAFYEPSEPGGSDDGAVGLLVMLALSNSMPPLMFGLVFAIPSLKMLKKQLGNKLSSISPTSSAASSSSE